MAPLKIDHDVIWDKLLKLEFVHSVQTILRTKNMLPSTAMRMIRYDEICLERHRIFVKDFVESMILERL